MSKGQNTPTYELKTNFKKCPICKSKNIKKDKWNVTCHSCGRKFFRHVRIAPPHDERILVFNLEKRGQVFIDITTKEVVTFT